MVDQILEVGILNSSTPENIFPVAAAQDYMIKNPSYSIRHLSKKSPPADITAGGEAILNNLIHSVAIVILIIHSEEYNPE